MNLKAEQTLLQFVHLVRLLLVLGVLQYVPRQFKVLGDSLYKSMDKKINKEMSSDSIFIAHKIVEGNSVKKLG